MESTSEGPIESGKLYSLEGALSTKLVAYLNNSEMTDITIKYGRRLFKAHRLILGSRSDILTEMMDKSVDETFEVDPDATEQEVAVFESVLRFMYTGEITFSEANVKIIMQLSNRLGLKKLGEMAVDWVGARIDRGCLVDAITWMRDESVNNLSSLKNYCIRTLALHFQYIPQAFWCDLSKDEVFSILDHPEIVVKSEESVIKRIDEWLEGKMIPEKENVYQEMSKRIRLPFVRAAKLISLQETSSIIRFVAASDPKSISEALKYRALVSEFDSDPLDDDDYALAKVFRMGANLRLYLQSPISAEFRSGRRYGEDGLYTMITYGKRMGHSYPIPFIIQDANKSFVHYLSEIITYTPDLVSLKTQNSEAWCVRYDISLLKFKEFGGVTFRIVFDARPREEDNGFYLPDHPLVTVYEGSFQETSLEEGSDQYNTSVTTPPIFAGKRPQSFLIATYALLNAEKKIKKPMRDGLLQTSLISIGGDISDFE